MTEYLNRANNSLVNMAQGSAEDKYQNAILTFAIAKQNNTIMAFGKIIEAIKQKLYRSLVMGNQYTTNPKKKDAMTKKYWINRNQIWDCGGYLFTHEYLVKPGHTRKKCNQKERHKDHK